MSDQTIQITVDGKPLTAQRGQMLIEVTDAAGIDVPRFCYHRKLSVAANCRMCLVEVEKAPKPLPACATPCMPDMVVHTASALARNAQKGTMEFLLINHPLDCPICDQGGECELQDVAMGYGNSVSQYSESKRVVFDRSIGPLIATEMTRCIHCTRCVRFGEEIAGVRELGATGRGEHMRIGTFIERSLASEVSGNVIDICPVGALTAKPSRFTARAWELTQHPAVSPHDSVGSNLYLHLDGKRVNRVVPRGNEAINEVWIADRDRFAYQGLRSEDRIQTPMVRVDGELQACDWPTALQVAANALRCEPLGVLSSASGPLEELYLSQKLARALGSPHIDHRLGQTDFRSQEAMPVMPWLGMSWPDLETLDAALLIGSNIRKDQPIAALRLRKAALKGGAVSFLNPRGFPLHFDALEQITPRYDYLSHELCAVALAAGIDKERLPASALVTVQERHRRVAESLRQGERTAVLLGNLAVQHPDHASLHYIAACLAETCDATLGFLPERANTAGAWLAGVLPHRLPGGKSLPIDQQGQHAAQMFATGMSSWLLIGVEPEFDAANPSRAMQILAQAEHVVAIQSWLSDHLRQTATVVLPAAAFSEGYATFVNATGHWQSSSGVSQAPGEARPAWKILCVLAQTLELPGFDFDSPEQICAELQAHCQELRLDNRTNFKDPPTLLPVARAEEHLLRAGETPIHVTDPLVRRSTALQKSPDGQQAMALLCQSQAEELGVGDGQIVRLRQQGSKPVSLPVRINESIPPGCVWVPSGLRETRDLGELYGPLSLEPV